MINGQISMWIDELSDRPSFPTLEGPIETDFAVVGGGLSGLWTAYHLKKERPSAKVTVFESRHVAFGASGRACGWMSGKPIGVRDVLARSHGRDAVVRTEAIVRDSLDEIVQLFDTHGKDIGAHKGGTLQVARSRSEAARVRSSVLAAHRWGVPEDRMQFLDAVATRSRVELAGAVAASFSPDMVRVDPARMTIALAEIVTEMGVQIYERSQVSMQRPLGLSANGHRIRAGRVAIATEGYTSQLPGMGRQMLPMNSSLIATRRLTDAEWDRIGWKNSEGLSGAAHTYFYSARTPDGRIALGGRGKAYRYGSGFDTNGVVDAGTIDGLRGVLDDLFPQVSLDIDFSWCGVIGVARDWSPFVHRLESSGAVMMGGYVGQGLTAAHLAGRIATSLLTDSDDEYAQLPWVRSLPRKWEPEPLRWLGANGLYRVYSLADIVEHRRGTEKTAAVTALADRVAGRTTRPYIARTEKTR